MFKFWIFTLLSIATKAEPDSKGYCAIYHGKICIKYFNNTETVWYSEPFKNEDITSGLWDELITRLKEPCRSAAEKLLCTYAFPKCVIETSSFLPLCYEDCIAVKQQFCYNDWAHIEDKKVRGISLKSRGHFRLPDCDKLPKYKVENKMVSCSYAALTEMNKEEVTCEA